MVNLDDIEIVSKLISLEDFNTIIVHSCIKIENIQAAKYIQLALHLHYDILYRQNKPKSN